MRTLVLATALAAGGCTVGDTLDDPIVEEQPFDLLPDTAPGDTIVVDGLELFAPAPGEGVATSVVYEDGSTRLVRLETTPAGEVMRFHDGVEVHEVEPPHGYLEAGRPECARGAYSRMGFKWTKQLRWRLNFASRPSSLSRDATLTALRRAVNNITQQHNHCGMADRVSATAQYAGETSRRAGISSAGACVANDGVSVMDFGALPSGTLAVACTFYSGGRAGASDIRFNKAFRWYTGSAPPAGCSGRFSLRGVATHELGHAFGLGHVSEAQYPSLTMSTHIAPCTNSPSSLGRGDIRGFRSLY